MFPQSSFVLVALCILSSLSPLNSVIPSRQLETVIAVQNASDLPVALGRGALIKAALSPDGDLLAALSTNALSVYDADDLAAPPRIFPFAVDLYGARKSAYLIRLGELYFSDSNTVVVRVPDDETGEERRLQINIATDEQTLLPVEAVQPIDAALAALDETKLPEGAQPVGGDGQRVILISEDDTSLIVWESASETETARITLERCRDVARSALLSADGQWVYLIYGGGAGFIQRYNLATSQLDGQAGGFGMLLNRFAFDPAGDRLYAAASDSRPEPCAMTNPGNGIVVYDPQTRAEVGFIPTDGPATAVAVGPDGLLAVGIGPRRIEIFRDETLATTLTQESWSFIINELVFSPDGRWLATLTGNQLIAWDTAAERLTVSTPQFTAETNFSFWGNNLALIDDVLVYVDGNFVRGVDLPTGSAVFALEHRQSVNSLAWHAPTQTLAVTTGQYNEVTEVLTYRVADAAATAPTLIESAVLSETSVQFLVTSFNADGDRLLLSQPPGDIILPASLILDIASLAVVDADAMLAIPSAFTPDGRAAIGAFGQIVYSYALP